MVLVVYNQLLLTQACLASLWSTSRPFELCVVDNASADGTLEYFRAARLPVTVRYHRNAENVGLIRALNQGAALVETEFACFLHNDTEMVEPEWLTRLHGAVEADGGVGLAGLYGARRLRRDGRYAGRTIVHSLVDGGSLTRPTVEVAAVDGVCLFLRRALLDQVGGFDEGYGFFHGYDRDLSFAVRARGYRCVVVHAPFRHRGGGTRTGTGAPRRPAEDLEERRAALARFAAKWGHQLPADVRGVGARVTDWVRARVRTS